MKKIMLFLAFGWAAAGAAPAQTLISGQVQDQKGQPIVGANVYLKDAYDGASTDASGTFRFQTKASGPQTVGVTYLGFQPREEAVQLTGQAVEIRFVLQEERNALNAVVITAGSFEASDTRRTTVLKPLDIATTAGATADVAAALNTLPGAQRVGEEGRLFVRGGEAYETRTFIDGLPVQTPFASTVPNVPARGRFSPFLFSGLAFSSGGYSAEYGQALSSALLLHTTDLAPETVTGVSLMSIGGSLSHTQRWENTSLALTADYSNLRPYFGLVEQQLDWQRAPQNQGSSAIFRHRTSPTGLFKAYGSFRTSGLALRQPDFSSPAGARPVDLHNRNLFLNTSYKEILGPKWSLRSGLAFSRDREEIGYGPAHIVGTDQALHAKVAAEHELTPDVWLRLGVEDNFRTYRQQYREEEQAATRGVGFDDNNAAAFAEADVYASARFVARPGARLEYSSVLQQPAFSPRLSLAYKLGSGGQVSGAWGHFYQTPEERFLKWRPELTFERATHYLANYQYSRDERTFRVEGYHKQYRNLVQTNQAVPTAATAQSNGGSGYARGLELFWRDQKTFRYGDYWVSYSLLDTRRHYRHFPQAAAPAFASRHNLSVVGKYFLKALDTQVGGTFSLASPRPFHDPNQPGFLQGRTPAFHDLSANVSYLTNIRGHFTILYVSVTNLLGRDNVFGYQFSPLPDEDGRFSSRPIGQPARRFAFVGLFISVGKKSGDNITVL